MSEGLEVGSLQRAFGECVDENEKMIGIAEAKSTLDRICCLHENESDIKRVLSKL